MCLGFPTVERAKLKQQHSLQHRENFLTLINRIPTIILNFSASKNTTGYCCECCKEEEEEAFHLPTQNLNDDDKDCYRNHLHLHLHHHHHHRHRHHNHQHHNHSYLFFYCYCYCYCYCYGYGYCHCHCHCCFSCCACDCYVRQYQLSERSPQLQPSTQHWPRDCQFVNDSS